MTKRPLRIDLGGYNRVNIGQYSHEYCRLPDVNIITVSCFMFYLLTF